MVPAGLADAFIPTGTAGAGHANGRLRAGRTATADPRPHPAGRLAPGQTFRTSSRVQVC